MSSRYSALQAMDMDDDGMVDWGEFELYLKWAGRQYPDTVTSEDLLDVAFRYGLMPAIQDVMSAHAQGMKGDDEDEQFSDDESFRSGQ